jgi:hypothetical protein
MELHVNGLNLVSHYTKPCTAIKILEGSSLLLGSVCDLDDPRERSLGWLDWVVVGDDPPSWIATTEAMHSLVQEVGRRLQLLCVAGPTEDRAKRPLFFEEESYGRPRMWAQYGGNYKGVCILLHEKNLNQAISEAMEPGEMLFNDPVIYVDWLEIVQGGVTLELIDGVIPDRDQISQLINANDNLRSIFFKKHSDWAQEAERRWLLFSNTCDRKRIDISTNVIAGLVLGDRFPPSLIEKLKGLCRSLGIWCKILTYSHPRYDMINLL